MQMTPRVIHTLMRRLFYGDISASNAYRHLMVNGKLDRAKLNDLVATYIRGGEVIVYADAKHCACCPVENAYDLVREYLPHGRVKLAAPDFSGLIIIESIGVGVGTFRCTKTS